jgi:hypothetical protein
MATTTNYGWTTPDDTALVKDGAAAIRSLGTSVDTTTKNLNPSTTLGDIEYRSSTANTNTRLGIGSTGNVLTVAGGVPTWAAPAPGGGKVLQVVSATYSTTTSTSSSTLADTGLTASITPSSATSKVLVIVSQNGCLKNNTNTNQQMKINIMRGATEILADFAGGATYTGSSLFLYIGSCSASYLDSPSTTSSTTYKTQFSNINNSNGVSVQGDNCSSTITLLEIGA